MLPSSPVPCARLVGCGFIAVALALVPAAPRAQAAEAAPRPLAGVSPCALLEGLPEALDPVRRIKAVAPIFQALDKARDAKAFRTAHARLEAALGRLLDEASALFHPPGDDAEVDPKRAQRFLSRNVFSKDGLLRVGDEALEPRPELAATLAWAACRAGRRDEASAVGRRLSGPDAAPLRAFSALLLLEEGRRAEAAELVWTLGREGFLAPWVRVELSADADERRALHALASRRVVTPDQQTALREQARRLEAPAP